MLELVEQEGDEPPTRRLQELSHRFSPRQAKRVCQLYNCQKFNGMNENENAFPKILFLFLILVFLCVSVVNITVFQFYRIYIMPKET